MPPYTSFAGTQLGGFLLLWAVHAFAANNDNYQANASNSALSHLRLSPSARIAALGEAGSTTGCDASSAFVNPALSARAQAMNVTMSGETMTLDRKHLLAGAVYPLEMNISAFTIGWTGWGLSDFERRDENGFLAGKFADWENTIWFGYAGGITPRLLAGCALKYHTHTLDTARASGYSGDVGLLFAVTPRLLVALSGRNFGTGLRWSTGAEDRIAPSYRAGIAIDSLLDRAAIAVEGEWTNGNSPQGYAGIECAANSLMTFRMGLQGPNPIQAGLGVGLSFQNWILDYAYVLHGSELGDSHLVSLVWRLGKPIVQGQ